MAGPQAGATGTPFLEQFIPVLMENYFIDFLQDSTCMEYFLYTRENRHLISRSLIISHARFSDSLYVSKFYPEIYKELNCKYLSAACFYMIVHHAAKNFHLKNNCLINLESERSVFDKFYARLKEFDFKIGYHRSSDRVLAEGRYQKFWFDTNEIQPCLG